MTGLVPTLPHVGSDASSCVSQAGETSLDVRQEVWKLRNYVIHLKEIIVQLAPNITFLPAPRSVHPLDDDDNDVDAIY